LSLLGTGLTRLLPLGVVTDHGAVTAPFGTVHRTKRTFEPRSCILIGGLLVQLWTTPAWQLCL